MRFFDDPVWERTVQISETRWQVSPSMAASTSVRSQDRTDRRCGDEFSMQLCSEPIRGDSGSTISSASSVGSRFARHVDLAARSYRREQRAIDAGMARLAADAGSAQELLALQMQVSEAGLKVELATRIVDRVASGVRYLLSVEV